MAQCLEFPRRCIPRSPLVQKVNAILSGSIITKGDDAKVQCLRGHVEVATLDVCNVDASFAECWPELQKIERLALWLLCDRGHSHSLC